MTGDKSRQGRFRQHANQAIVADLQATVALTHREFRQTIAWFDETRAATNRWKKPTTRGINDRRLTNADWLSNRGVHSNVAETETVASQSPPESRASPKDGGGIRPRPSRLSFSSALSESRARTYMYADRRCDQPAGTQQERHPIAIHEHKSSCA